MSDSRSGESGEQEWLTLDDGEELVWSGKPHQSSLIPALIIGVPLAVVLVGLVIIAAAYLYRENTRYVVTTDALYRKSGVLSRDVQRIGFEKVQNTSYNQGFFGTQFGYGTVDISTAGGAGVEMQFQSVPEPRHVQETINQRMKVSHGDTAEETDETKSEVLDEILQELRAIRERLDTRDAESDEQTAVSESTAASLSDEDADTGTRTGDE